MTTETMTTPTEARQLRAAADYLREHGWQQGANGGEGGPACIHGAIHEVIGERRCGDLLHILESRVRGHVIDWQDTPGRTVEEVLAALDPEPSR